MLGANRATLRLCEVLWHSPTTVDPLSKFGSSTQRVLRQHVVSPGAVASNAGSLVQGAQVSVWPLLMQSCSFSQLRVYSAQSEMKEAMNRQDMTQSKRSFEVKEDVVGKRFRLDSDDSVPGLDEFSAQSYEWQQVETSMEAHRHHEVVPVYGVLDDDDSRISSESVCNEDVVDNMAVDKKKDILKKKVRKFRTWQYTDMAGKMESGMAKGMEFTLMSYNILAQDLLEDNFYLYGLCDQDVLNWDFRSQNLIAEIEAAQPDVLCLQELTQGHYEEYFKPRLSSLGWNSLYKKRTGGKCDGCAIFFKRSLFELDSFVSVEYFKPGVRLLDRDNVGLIVVLKPTGTSGQSNKLCVATTHLLFNPRRGDIKLTQLQLLLAELDKVAFKKQDSSGTRSYHPVILCGDMNSEPYSPLYQFLTCGELVYDGLLSGNVSGQREGCNRGKTIYQSDLELPELGVSSDCQYTRHFQDQSSSHSPSGCLRHKFSFASAYKHISPTGETPVTTHHKKASCIVDYIFYSSSGGTSGKEKERHQDDQLHLLGTLRLPTQQEVVSLGGLPNAALSSDHLSLSAKFFLNLSPGES